MLDCFTPPVLQCATQTGTSRLPAAPERLRRRRGLLRGRVLVGSLLHGRRRRRRRRWSHRPSQAAVATWLSQVEAITAVARLALAVLPPVLTRTGPRPVRVLLVVLGPSRRCPRDRRRLRGHPDVERETLIAAIRAASSFPFELVDPGRPGSTGSAGALAGDLKLERAAGLTQSASARTPADRGRNEPVPLCRSRWRKAVSAGSGGRSRAEDPRRRRGARREGEAEAAATGPGRAA